jgi:uncharacterized DUF497 family protein
MSLVFEWDNRKARRNLEKHRVGFVEADSVFSDPLARIFVDEDHMIDEPRESPFVGQVVNLRRIVNPPAGVTRGHPDMGA